jgi:hypothetical protein
MGLSKQQSPLPVQLDWPHAPGNNSRSSCLPSWNSRSCEHGVVVQVLRAELVMMKTKSTWHVENGVNKHIAASSPSTVLHRGAYRRAHLKTIILK